MSVKHAGFRRSLCSAAAAAGLLFLGSFGAPALAGNDLDLHRDTRLPRAPEVDVPFPVLPVAPQQVDEGPSDQPDDGPAALAESNVDSIDDLVPSLQSEQMETNVLDASIPGISDEELQRFKKQMYRKDI